MKSPQSTSGFICLGVLVGGPLILVCLPVAASPPSRFEPSFSLGNDMVSDVLSDDDWALSSSAMLGRERRRRRRRPTEAMIRLDDVDPEEVEENLLDLRTYSANEIDDDFAFPNPLSSKSSTSGLQNRFGMRLPSSFRDPFVEEDSRHAVQQQQQLDNHHLLQKFGSANGKPNVQLLSTGTTIAGVCGYDAATGEPFVVLGADTRATAGNMVADKRCQKIHCLARNMWACGAGTAADLDQVTRHCRYALALGSLMEKESIGNGPRRWGPPPLQDGSNQDDLEERLAEHAASMGAACRFFRNLLYEGNGETGANLIVGGIDEETGIPHIRAVHPHGSMDTLPYAALGSGGLAAMAVIESRYNNAELTLVKGIQIVTEAILSGIQNDMGSGSQVDLCVIRVRNGRVVSNYTRAAMPEEEIIEAEGWFQEQENPSTEASVESQSTPGVNGFGNYPFLLRSKRLIVPSRETEAKDRAQQWNTLLHAGIEQED